MARRFFFVSAGIFLLAGAYHLGVRTARADWDLSSAGDLVGFATPGFGEAHVVTREGKMWQVTYHEWTQWTDPEADLPVPTAMVKFFGPGVLITKDEVAWVYAGTGIGWISKGPFPGSPVPVDGRSFGSIKAQHR